ncbi:ATPase, T2SS/T4P/T4SS family [Alicyclobacillus fodiniaquatilis]|uniref:ATPase, T2SS/T4P/T4SS family n=1 Tax=Alicyclobacillus fodiniaquatilis TaxID=1661150 RepID=A0ABW4JES2_9BACL
MATVSELFQPIFVPSAFITSLQGNRVHGASDHGFKKLCDTFDDYLDTLHDRKGDDYLERQHGAIVGDVAAKSYFIDEIHNFLRARPEFQQVGFPTHYPNLAEAIFQQVLGFGPLSIWFQNPTEAAHVIGTKILFQRSGSNRKEIQSFRFESLDQVYQLIRSITLWDPLTQVSATTKWTEVNMLDGTRVTIIVPPLSSYPMLIFRQYPFKSFTFEHEAQRKTIDTASTRLWKILSRLMLNTVVTGFRGSGKTTFLKVIYGARDEDMTVITVERDTFEIRLDEAFPERAGYILPVRPSLDMMTDLFAVFLRADAHYIIVPEMRSGEIEIVLRSKERGNGYLVTYHGQDIPYLPAEMARLSLERFPSRDYQSELIRAAKSLDVAVWMDELPNGRKVVLGVYAFSYSEETGDIEVVPWVVYDRQSETWSYSDYIPAPMAAKLQNLYPELFESFQRELKRLSTNHKSDAQIKRLNIKEAM